MPTEAELLAKIAQLEAQLKSRSTQTEDGAIAQGEKAIAVGAGGMYVGSIYHGVPPANDAQALKIYCELLASATSSLPLRGVDRAASDPANTGIPIGLANVYVDLDTTTVKHQKSDEPAKPAKRLKSSFQDNLPDWLSDSAKNRSLTAIEALIVHPRLVLLGDPGSGKSTFVNFVAHCLTMHLLQPKSGWLGRLPGWPSTTPLLPVVITLRDFARCYADTLPENAEPSHLWNFIVERLVAQNLPQATQPIEQALQSGFALLLLDGLDEVPTLAQRLFARNAVRAFLGRYPKSRALITCRVLSYQPPTKGKPDLRLVELPTSELADFDEKKIQRFIQAWYTELGRLKTVKVEDVDALVAHLQTAVQRPDLASLAPTPLLLTVMALVHTHQGHLPDARALLYEETVDILLWRWEQIKLGGQENAPRLRQYLIEAGRTDIDLKRVLWKLAYNAHAATKSDASDDDRIDISEHDLEIALAALKPLPDHDGGDRNWALKVIDVIKSRSGLMLERQPNVFTFPHRTFQEYLAGAELASQKQFARKAAELARQGILWREVILNAVGRLIYVNGDPEKALALISELCPEKESNQENAWRSIWLAGDVLQEIGINRACETSWGSDLTERVRQRLARLITLGCLAPMERARTGNTLAKLNDPRLEVTTIDGMQFCLVAPSPFVMGSEQVSDDEKPQHTNAHLNYPYWIARYPVTVAQWRLFVDATQLSFDRWQYNSRLNHPVVAITWHEALEFCHWLNKLFATTLPKGYCFSLPSEAEWEKAARGGEQLPQQTMVRSMQEGLAIPQSTELVVNPIPDRDYPWQGKFDSNKANTSETGISDTSVVGCFPDGASLYGVLDMSGNVWEWTRSAYKSYPYDPGDGRENVQAMDVTRVLRGGSFTFNARGARCACRGRFFPDGGDGYVGFRLAVSLCQ